MFVLVNRNMALIADVPDEIQEIGILAKLAKLHCVYMTKLHCVYMSA